MVQPPSLETPLLKSYWVIPGSFLAGEYPGSLYPESAIEKVMKLLKIGVNYFIDLTQEGELDAYEPLVHHLAEDPDPVPVHKRMPIQDYEVPSKKEMKIILDTLDTALQDGRTVYLHCWGGVGRTGTVVGCYLVRHGWTSEEALKEINRLREVIPPGLRRNSPESAEQFEMVRNWQEGD